jgi:hypothetical protein
MPGGRQGPGRPRPSHRQQSTLRGRLVAAGVFAVAVLGLGVAVATGAVRMPLTASSSSVPRDVMLKPVPTPSAGEADVNSHDYALATVPASWAAEHLSGSTPPTPKPSKSATAKPTHSTTAPTAPASTSSPATEAAQGLTPQPTAEYETPSGENQKAWSEAILTALGAPLTSANIVSIGYWMQNEAGKPPYGIVGANNPINVSEACCGGVPIQDDGDGVTFLQSYPTVADGVQAIAEYLNRGNYTLILADLKAGVGLMSDPNLASEISLFSGGGYSTIPDSYGQGQGTPLS